MTFVGHFEGGASAPVFKLDTPTGIANSGFGDVANPPRAPISSGCTANPTNADGASCQGGAIGTPFLLYTAGEPGRPAALRPGIRADRRVDARRDRRLRDGRDAERIGESGRRRHPDPLRLRRDDGLRHQHGGRSPRRRERRDRLRRDGERAHPGRDASTSEPSRRRTSSPSMVPTRASWSLNTPPTVSIDDLPDKVKAKQLGRGRLLTVQLTVSEPATITLDILNKKGKIPSPGDPQPDQRRLLRGADLAEACQGQADPSRDGDRRRRRERRGRATIPGEIAPAYPSHERTAPVGHRRRGRAFSAGQSVASLVSHS